MKLAIIQPYFLPYLGYFQLINAVDEFVIYDDVNFIKGGWINRNQILLNGSTHLFSLHCQKVSRNKKINEILVFDEDKTHQKLLVTFKHAYNNAPLFDDVIELLNAIMWFKDKNLALFITNSIQIICDYLDISTKLTLSSVEFAGTQGLQKADRLISINKARGCNHYVNAINGTKLYSKEYFSKMGINLSFLKTNFNTYEQFSNNFVHGLSIIDILMFNSKAKVKVMLEEYSLL